MDPTSSPIETVNTVALYALVKLPSELSEIPTLFSNCFEPQRLQALQLPRDDPCGRIPQNNKEAECDPEVLSPTGSFLAS